MNRQHISLREGKAFIDGNQVLDCITFKVTFKPKIAESTSLGQQGTDRRWINGDYEIVMSQYKSTPWIKKAIDKYSKTGETPVFTIQGIQNDKNSDFNKAYGNETRTFKDCVPTGDMPLMELDTDGELVKEEVTFGAKSMV